MKTILAILLSAASAFAGRSLQLSTQTASSAVPKVLGGVSFRVQFSIHDWDTGNRTGVPIRWTSSNLFVVQVLSTGTNAIAFQAYTDTDNASVCNASLTGLPSQFVTVRWQHSITTGTSGTDYCQAWDSAGTMVLNTSSQFTTNSTATFNDGVMLNGLSGSTAVDFAYFQIYGDIVPTNARPPVTADTTTNCLVYLKFDLGNNTGSLNDACSTGPYNASLSSGSPTYVATPSQNLVISTIKLAAPPLWGNIASVRAGFPAQLDGSASYSQADASATTTYLWSLLSGPSAVTLDSNTSATPTTQSPYTVFGDYNFQLAATDVNSVTATSSQHIGSVYTDTNGVVATGNPLVDSLFGPLIAWGRNPWGYQDYWHKNGSDVRLADYTSASTNPVAGSGWITGASNKPQWEYTGQGTVSFYFNCVGGLIYSGLCNSSVYSGTVSGSSVAVGATSFVASTITGLDLTTFPTHVIVVESPSVSSEVRICSNTGTTLNVCYDGWGDAAAHTYAVGSLIIQAKVTGTGTLFLTDATAPVCPVGAPGPPGPSLYSTGTISLTAGSATVTGSGTTFTTAMVGSYLRVATTHSTSSFVFVALISGFTDATHLTLGRVYPATADTASGLSYNIMLGQRTAVFRYPHTVDPSGDGEVMFGNPGGCESETTMYTNPLYAGNTFGFGYDLIGTEGTLVTGKTYSVTDKSGWVTRFGTFNISFYGESLAHRALYYRSGLTSALTAADYLADWWVKSPWGNADVSPGLPLVTGGEVIGAFVSAVLTGRVSWPDLRGWAMTGKRTVDGIATQGCNAYADSRDSGYALAWLILAAIYDPDTTSTAAPGGIPWRTYWQNQIAQMKTNDDNCKRTDSSFANGFYFNTGSPQITLTNGNSVATGSGIPSSICNGVASGTATVTNGSNAMSVITGSIPSGLTMYLTGTTGAGASVFFQALAYSGTGSAATLGGNWLGDSGTISWTAATQDGSPFVPSGGTPGPMLTIATDNNDLTNLQKNWSCTWNSASSVTLNRPWDGTSGTYRAYATNLAGYGQQPFMLGIKTYGMNLLASQTLPALSAYVAPYQTLVANSSSWIWNTGMDPQLLGTNYGRIFQQCEGTNTSPSGTSLGFRSAGCTFGNQSDSVILSREQNAETSAAHGIYYQNNLTPTNLTQGDKWYGALWCSTPYTTGGVFCDTLATANNLGASNLTDAYLHVGKWFGFFGGVGMSSRWPAVRLGGAQVTTTPVGITNGKAVLRGISR